MSETDARDVDALELENGATIMRIAPDCEVCTNRGEDVELSTHRVEFEEQKVYLCIAHTQEVLDLNEDKLKKGEDNIFGEIFGSSDT